MKQASDIILDYLGKDDSLVEYRDKQDDTTLLKLVDASKAARELGHVSTVPLAEGIPRTIEWQKEVYGVG
jgi:dTDP-glucose 4,6-dehydratase